jgi:hypothetical protein
MELYPFKFQNFTKSSYFEFMIFNIRPAMQELASRIMKQSLVDGAGDELSNIQDGVLEGISKGLESLGQNVREVFYSEMEGQHNLGKDQILSRPEEFSEAISGFFRTGSSIVERTIAKEIVEIFGIPSCPGINFRTALEIVRRHPWKGKKWGSKLRDYDPALCKTCQKLHLQEPKIARVPFSDCENHFMKRVFQLRRTVRTAGRLRFAGFIS